MGSLIKRNASGIVLTGLLFVQALMVGQQVRTDGETRLSYWSGTLLLPLQSAAKTTFGAFSETWDRYVWLVRAEQENRQLDSEAARLRIENYFLRQELLRFQSRQELDAYMVSLESGTLTARVIGSSPDRAAKEVFLNRGRAHGVRPGMAVISPDGIVGKVGAAYGTSSMVVLITDLAAGAGVILGSSGEPAVLRGTGTKSCRLEHVGPHVRVHLGEMVYTSGQDGIYPMGLPVGRVTGVKTGVELQAVQLRPLAPLEGLDHVLVLLDERTGTLPEDVQRLIARFPGSETVETGSPGVTVRSLGIDADQVKQAYRMTLEAQNKKIGATDYTGPPDFEGVSGASRAASATRQAEETQR